jgi:AcrR family transcriptional regulator
VPRTRSEDYEEKKNLILDVAASMFAESGYMVCKMEDIAARCNVSKSMLYHYFKKKEDVLFEIVQEHVLALNRTIEEFLLDADHSDQRKFFSDFISRYLEKSTQARERHAVTLKDTRWLIKEQMARQEELGRRNVDLFVKVIKKVSPNYSMREYKVYAYLLIGMVNRVGLWYRSSGPMSSPELYDRIAVLFLQGFLPEYRPTKANFDPISPMGESVTGHRKRAVATSRARQVRGT